MTTKTDAGIIDNSGVVSSSGYGDGGYEASVIKTDGKIVAVKIDFGMEEKDIYEEDDEEDDDEDNEEDDDKDDA